ncbi:MAG: aminotransferase [Acidobacteria bacterium]|nr:MAG: aminotransferase [Acidobacteriota bacterium]
MGASLAHIREEFPALRDKIFFDSAGVGIAPRSAVGAIHEFLDQTMFAPVRSMVDHHLAIDAAREKARPEAARLIGASEDEIALIESTTHGLTIAARALRLKSGDNIVTTDLEFIAVPFAWRQPKSGIYPEIRVAKNKDGGLPLSSFEEVIDGRTKAVVISSVQWSNGYLCDLEGICKLCRQSGVLLIVDAIQQLGAFPLDVSKVPVDIVVCGGHKWLNAPFGAGFMYIRKGISDKLRPPVAGYLSLKAPVGGWGTYFETPSITPLQPVEFSPTARAYENGGTANYPGGIGLAVINELGKEVIEKQIRTVTNYLLEGLDTLRMNVVTPRSPLHRSGIIAMGFPGSPHKDIALKEHLLDRKILVAVRYTSNVGGVRVSCHFYNNKADVDRLLNAVEDYLARNSELALASPQ